VSYEWLRKRVEELAARAPHGYTLVDNDGREVLTSELEPLDWYQDVVALLNDPTRSGEVAELREKLDRVVSSRPGCLLWQVARVLLAGPIKTSAS